MNQFIQMNYTDNLKGYLLLYKDNYKGYNFYVVSYGTHPCCYIGIPRGSKFYGVSYLIELEDLNVHGGVTYTGVLLPSDERFTDPWYIGWDYAHACDYNACLNDICNKNSKQYTTEELITDCVVAIDDLIDLINKGGDSIDN